MLLADNERFQNDTKRWSQEINALPDGQKKIECTKLLNDLIYEVKNMDNMHMDMIFSKQLTSMGGELKNKILAIRKKLDSKLKN
jgi:hypothetical protein